MARKSYKNQQNRIKKNRQGEGSKAKKKLRKRADRKLKQQCINATSTNISFPNKDRNIDSLRVKQVYKKRKAIKRNYECVKKQEDYVCSMNERSKRQLEYTSNIVGNLFNNYNAVDVELNFNEKTCSIEGLTPYISPVFKMIPPKIEMTNIPIIEGIRNSPKSIEYNPKRWHASIIKNPIVDKRYTPYGKLFRECDERTFFVKRYGNNPEMMALWNRKPEETVKFYAPPKRSYQIPEDAPNPLKSLKAAEEYLESIRPAPTQKLNIEVMRTHGINDRLIQNIQWDQQQKKLTEYPLSQNPKPESAKTKIIQPITIPNPIPNPLKITVSQATTMPSVLNDILPTKSISSEIPVKTKIRVPDMTGYCNSKVNFPFKNSIIKNQPSRMTSNCSQIDIMSTDILVNIDSFIPIISIDATPSITEMTFYGMDTDDDDELQSSSEEEVILGESDDELIPVITLDTDNDDEWQSSSEEEVILEESDDEPIPVITLDADETVTDIDSEQIFIANAKSDSQYQIPTTNQQSPRCRITVVVYNLTLPSLPTFDEFIEEAFSLM